MHVVIAPNAFRGGPSAPWIAAALAQGARGLPGVSRVSTLPLSDGGDGTLDAAEWIFGGQRIPVTVSDPLGRPCVATYLMTSDRTAFVESAQASGLHRIKLDELDPLRASTKGTGDLMLHALRGGARRLVVGAGGTASVDMGAGALTALGVRFLDADDREIPAVPARLGGARRVDVSALPMVLGGRSIQVLSDVSTPLGANITEFGRQKGIGSEQAMVIGQALNALGECFGDHDGVLQRTRLLGAGGGLAAGLCVAAQAQVASGTEYFIAVSRLGQLIRDADLVVTAEGRLDRTSLAGKLPYGIARLASSYGKPTVIVTGEARMAPWQLPAGTRIVELGSPPAPGQEASRERAQLLARSLCAAMSDREGVHALPP